MNIFFCLQRLHSSKWKAYTEVITVLSIAEDQIMVLNIVQYIVYGNEIQYSNGTVV